MDKSWLLLLPGGTLLLIGSLITGIGQGPHANTVKDGVDIFKDMPYKEQIFLKKHPGECYDASNTYNNGDLIQAIPKYGPCSIHGSGYKIAHETHIKHTIWINIKGFAEWLIKLVL